MIASKKRGRPKGSHSSLADRATEHWLAVGGEVARRVGLEKGTGQVARIIDEIAVCTNLSHRAVERAYGDFCEYFPGSAPGAKPSKETWLEAFAKMKVDPNITREIFLATTKPSPERFRQILLPETRPSAEYSPRNMFKKRKVRRPISAKKR